jgi:hypothetical protein
MDEQGTAEVRNEPQKERDVLCTLNAGFFPRRLGICETTIYNQNHGDDH